MYTATASPYLGRSDRRARTADATLNWNVSLRKGIQLKPRPISVAVTVGLVPQMHQSITIQILGELRSYEQSQSSTILYYLSLPRSDLILKSSEEIEKFDNDFWPIYSYK